MDHRSQTVLITGASSGIGAAFAREVARRGSDLVLVARRAARLEALAAELPDVTVHVIPLDLGRPEAPAELLAEVDRRGIEVTALVNNAGFGDHGQVHAQDPDRLQQMVQLNVGTLVGLSRAFLPRLRAGTGYLVNVASVAAYQPIPNMAVYAASKAFVLSFTEALWYETRGTDLRVLCLSPGLTSTEFLDVAGDAAAGRATAMQTPEQVVATALHALDGRSTPSVVSGRVNRVTSNLHRLFPRRLGVELTARVTASGEPATSSR
ncbi:SDR family oxidoreductase [Pseudonocardia sp. WMMC193]|uniref:SDR family NAD(P)-dependent oxidoreductase n=1 Tax=Pseudonocardia sp. WMMC193 TaxID=2911965 RepID=UPI001F1843EF|nr:SDR family NAD(P)-dependent oxidoreductase [Pseudonocardia sp. WMMC193]MCF7551691.1 SDR family NAD(P)-dependent oxidoreductase [Pseudonocardia sp. WMMC193]